jgi:hypothetical protein
MRHRSEFSDVAVREACPTPVAWHRDRETPNGENGRRSSRAQLS